MTGHITICSIIQEMQQLAQQRSDFETVKLCGDAFKHARSMSARLEWYWKQSKNERKLSDAAARDVLAALTGVEECKDDAIKYMRECLGLRP